MVRIVGVDLPNKRLEIALTYIYGVGPTQSQKLIEITKLDRNKRANDLTEAEVAELRRELENNHTVEGDLRRKVRNDVQRLKDIGSWRGGRHAMGLPCRGQKTKCNARSWKGPRPAKAGARNKRK
jgi:small subunit ribosomal protein S13